MEKVISASVPVHMQDLLRPGGTGTVLLVSSSGVYVQLNGQIILLCDRKWGLLPIGIGVADFDHGVSLLRPEQGQPVAVRDNCLVFPSGVIRLEAQEPSCAGTGRVAPQLKQIRLGAQALAALGKERGISMLVLPLVLGRPPEQPLKGNPYCAYAYHYFNRLIPALEKGDPDGICSCVEKLLGLGPGLTPSADDCLLGMLYVFRALPRKAPAGAELLCKCIGRVSGHCTNRISAAYLKGILAGAPFERMEQVFRGLCGEEPLDIEKLTQIGSSSGSEMLLGMLIALKLCGYDAAQREELQ